MARNDMATINPHTFENLEHRRTRLPATIEHLDRLSYYLDNALRIPGTERRIGLDSLLGLIPGLGDAAGALISAYVIMWAARIGVPVSALLRMSFNLGIDAVLGALPFLGDLFDMGWKANTRNVRILRQQFADSRRLQPRPWHRLALLAVLPVAVLFVVIVILIFFGIAVIAQMVGG